MVLFLKTSAISGKQVSISDWTPCTVRTPPWQMGELGNFSNTHLGGLWDFFSLKGGLSMLGGLLYLRGDLWYASKKSYILSSGMRNFQVYGPMSILFCSYLYILFLFIKRHFISDYSMRKKRDIIFILFTSQEKEIYLFLFIL